MGPFPPQRLRVVLSCLTTVHRKRLLPPHDGRNTSNDVWDQLPNAARWGVHGTAQIRRGEMLGRKTSSARRDPRPTEVFADSTKLAEVLPAFIFYLLFGICNLCYA